MDTAPDLLSGQPFLAGLSAEHLAALAAHAHAVRFPAGHRLFDEEGTADRFWLLREGRVALDTVVPGRGEVILETLGPGAVLGWSWLFPPHRWHFGATCVTATSAVELDGPGVLALCERQPDLGLPLVTRFMQVVVQRLQSTRLRLLDLYGGPA
jgi:CRP-like cAMP-binding protein